MKILQVCSARTLGGGERHVADLANALTDRGHQVYVALAPDSPLIERLSNVPNMQHVTLRMRNALDLPSALKLARFVREQQIEIVHAHLARDYPLASFAARRGSRLVITRHVLFPLNRLHSLTLAHVTRVIAVSEAVARALRSQSLFPERRIQVISNGVELERFARSAPDAGIQGVREKLGFGRDRLLVGAVGSLLPMKGHEEFLRAAGIIAAQRADVDFVIIGKDETSEREYLTRLENLVAELGLSGRVRIMDWPDDLAPFYAALDVYISASRSEAFGLSIVEAMASARAVVATATEGALEILKDGTTGIVAPVGNVEKLVEAVAMLLDDQTKRSELGAHAREDARQRFSLERMVNGTEQVYLEAIETAQSV